jgi:putative aldouronate transport system substrate-binding protein
MRVVAALAFLAMGAAACWSRGGAERAAAVVPTVEITQLAWDRGTIPSGQGTIEDNWWTRYVNKEMARFGVKVRFVPVARALEAQKLPLMLASGTAPDLCFTYDTNLIKQSAKNGLIVDFTPLLAAGGQNIRSAYSQEDLAVGMIDGKLYSFVCKSNGAADTTWIRKDWLDELGLPVPASVADFHEMLKAFSRKDPGAAGNRLVPFALQGSPTQTYGIWESVVLPGFVKDPPTSERLLVPPPLWPEAKDALRFLNTLHSEHLLGDFILDKDGTLFRQRVIRGDVGSFVAFGHFPYSAAYGSIYEKLIQAEPGARLVAAFPWKHPQSPRNYINFFRNSPWLYQFFSPATTRHPELVMALLNWMASPDGYRAANFGVEGTDYRLSNGVPVPVDDAAYASRVPWVEPQYMAFMKPFSGPGQEALYLANASQSFPAPLRRQFVQETIATSTLLYSTPRITEPTPETDRLRAAIDKDWEEAMAGIVTAEPAQFSAVFDRAAKAYRDDGGGQVAAELVAAWERQQGRR